MKHCTYFEGGTCGHELENGGEVGAGICDECNRRVDPMEAVLKWLKDCEFEPADMIKLANTIMKDFCLE